MRSPVHSHHLSHLRLAAWVALVVMMLGRLNAQTTYTWTGAGANNNWTTAANWGGTAPSSSTSSYVVFAGTTRLSPNLTSARTVGAVTFASTAGAFTIGSTGGYTLTIGSGGITDNSSNTETISAALALSAAQTWTVNAGTLAVTGTVSTGYNNLTITGSGNTTISGAISGGSSGNTLTKSGSGTLTLSGDNSSMGHLLSLTGGDLILTNSNALGSSTWGNVISGGSLHLQNNITVTEGSFSIAGTGTGSGAIVNDSGANTLAATLNLTGDTTIASTAGTLTLSGTVNTNSSALTLTGAGNITVNAQVSGSGDLTTAGSGTTTFQQAIYTSGDVTLGGTGTIAVNSAIGNASSLTVSNSGTTTVSGAVSVNGALTVSGSGDTTFASTTSAGAVSVTGSGDTTFASTLNASSVALGGTGNITVSGDINSNGAVAVTNSNSAATVALAGSINAGSNTVTIDSAATVNVTGSQINTSGGLVVSGTGTVSVSSTLNLSGSSLTVSGAVDATFTGTQINVGAITISSAGDTTFDTDINASSLTLAGAGTTTLTGDGNNYISSVTVTSGELVLDKDSGYAVSGTVTVTGGTLTLAADDQTSSWTDITLSSGATLVLNDTTQTIDTLTISGDTVIDFGTSGSTLTINNIVFTDSSSTLTILNWSSAVDSFIAYTDPGTSGTSQVVISGSSGTTTWDSSSGEIGSTTPVPEAHHYGALLLALGAAALGWHRRRTGESARAQLSIRASTSTASARNASAPAALPS